MEFRRFFYQLNIYGFLLNLKLVLGDFLHQAIISNVTHLSKLTLKKKGNCNIIKSHDQLYDGSNLIWTVLYPPNVDLLLVICHLTYLTFLVNLLNQSSH